MVLVVAQHNLPKPCTDLARAMMLPALKLCLDGLSFATIRFFAVMRQTMKAPLLVALPTKVRETQKREGLGFSLATLFPVSGGEPPELDQSRLVRM